MRQALLKGTVAATALAGTAVAAALMIASPTPAQAQRARWCAQYDFSTSNCGFYTRAQCLAAISGVGGYCTLGLNGPAAYGYVPGGEYPRHYRHYRHYRHRY